MTAYITGCIILACMAGVSVTIIAPGLTRASGIVFRNLGPAVRALFPRHQRTNPIQGGYHGR